jgi:hypothetical protein
MVYPLRMGNSAGCSYEYVTEEGNIVSNDDQNMFLRIVKSLV